MKYVQIFCFVYVKFIYLSFITTSNTLCLDVENINKLVLINKAYVMNKMNNINSAKCFKFEGIRSMSKLKFYLNFIYVFLYIFLFLYGNYQNKLEILSNQTMKVFTIRKYEGVYLVYLRDVSEIISVLRCKNTKGHREYKHTLTVALDFQKCKCDTLNGDFNVFMNPT